MLTCVVVLSALAGLGCGGEVGARGSDAGSRDATSSDGSVELDAWLEDDADEGDAGWAEDDAGWAEDDAGWVEDDAGTAPPDDAGTTPRDASTPTTPEPTVAEGNYRVLHWNIAGGKENDCRVDLIARAVVRYVRENDVDFVGLNEVCPSQHDAIEGLLRRHWSVPAAVPFAAYVGDGGSGRVVGNSIFSRLGFVGGSVTRDRVGEDRYGTRNLLCAQIRGLPHLRFCSVHLTPGDAEAAVQLGRVRTHIEDWWATRRDTVILSGDLNLHPDHPSLNTIYSSAANTANNPNNTGRYREVDDDDPSHCRGYGERTTPGTTGGPCGEGGKIDFIFVRENRIVGGDYVGDTFNDPGDCTGICSDHRAVWGRIRVRIAL